MDTELIRLQLFQGLWSRFLPVYKQIRKELSEGSLGDIGFLRAEYCLPIYKSLEWIQKPELGGGSCSTCAIYSVALACMIFGEMPETITAVGQLTREGESVITHLDMYMKGLVLTYFENFVYVTHI